MERWAFVGGIDLTALAGDRLDGWPHDRNTMLGWHDAAARLEGPAVADVCAHFAMRWQATTGEVTRRARTDPDGGRQSGPGDSNRSRWHVQGAAPRGLQHPREHT